MKRAVLLATVVVALLAVSAGIVASVDGGTDNRPYCCCVGDGEGHYVCEPNRGECKCGCPTINCKPPR